MLESLRIRNFRMLDDFVVPRLGRVNLIVGRNNSGKSTVLEALRILASGGNPGVMVSLLDGHDETSVSYSKQTIGGNFPPPLMAFKSFFPEREFPLLDDQPITFGTESQDLLRIEHVFYQKQMLPEREEADGSIVETSERRVIVSKNSEKHQSQVFKQTLRISILRPIVNKVTNKKSKALIARHEFLDLDSQGRLDIERRFGKGVNPAWEQPCSYVPTDFVSESDLSDLWDQVALTAFEEEVIKSLQLIDGRLKGLAFIKALNSNRPRRIPMARLDGTDERVPLNSMGDGMLRVLQLALSIPAARDGFLLIDEFENGLHYSVQERVWQLIFSLANELNIQVFATTHSWDCIEAFSRASAVAEESESVLFRVGRSKLGDRKGLVSATVFSGEDLINLTQADVEIR